MTVAQFKKWLETRIQYLRGLPDYQEQEDHAYGLELLEEAYQNAVDLNLPECVAACKQGPVTVRLLECLAAIPEPESDTFTPPEIAQLLSVSADTVLGWIRSRELKASNIAARTSNRPRWVVRKSDLETFLKNRQPEPSKRATKIESSFKRYST